MITNHDSPATISPDVPRGMRRLQIITLVHAGGLVIIGSWWYGGNSPTAQAVLTGWGLAGLALTAFAAIQPNDPTEPRSLRWLWPLAVFSVLILVSLFNPSYRELTDGTNYFYVRGQEQSGWPSTARPDLSWRALLFFIAAYVSAFNVILWVRQRSALRWLLLSLIGNALLLSIFGTFQRLLGATGPYFGSVRTAQVHFFASFIYHNHWGAFLLLLVAATIGLVFHYERRRYTRSFRESPGLLLLVAVMLFAATVPLTNSRSSSLLMALLLCTALAYWWWPAKRGPLGHGSWRWRIVFGTGMLAAVFVFAFVFGRPVIEHRIRETRAQIADLQQGRPNGRLILYADTWSLAAEKLLFGWGMGAYPTVFYLRNSQRYRPDGFEVHYDNAHSDWLQSLTDVGTIGTGALVFCAVVPLWASRRRLRLSRLSPLPLFLWIGCGWVVGYATLEFPFGNRTVVCLWWLCFFTALQYSRLSVAREPSSPSAVC